MRKDIIKEILECQDRELLKTLNGFIFEKLEILTKLKCLEFSKEDKVAIEHPEEGALKGTVTKVKDKVLKVQVGTNEWTVTPYYCTKI